MSKRSTVFARRCFFALLLSLLVQQAPAQYTTPPQMEVATDKTTYQQYEPVLLTESLTNLSNEPQDYGPARLFYPYSRLVISFQAPDGSEVYSHTLGEVVVRSVSLVYQPGETRDGTMNLLAFFRIADQVGTYTVEVGYPREAAVPDDNYETAQVSFEVVAPSGVDPEVVAKLGYVNHYLRSGIFHMEVELPEREITIFDDLDTVLNTSGTPAYMDELALFLKGRWGRISWETSSMINSLRRLRKPRRSTQSFWRPIPIRFTR